MEAVHERFLRYVKMDTTSNEANKQSPSSEGQMVLARLLAQELKDMGVTNARADEHGYVYGEIPANCEDQPSIGLIAHMDTIDAVPGRSFNPRVVQYEGGDICLNAEKDIKLSMDVFPELAQKVGKRLIVTDGTTVLGADDKAGVAEIMTACERILQEDSIRHGKICIGFTPDEEIGRGPNLFDVPGFGADFAYTVDGGAIDEIEYENFNAASCKVTVHGRNIHPGRAKNKMKNAARIVMEFNAMLPEAEKPEYTEGYEGFYHLTMVRGDEENAFAVYILRDHDRLKLEERKAFIRRTADFLNARYGEGTVEVALRDAYRNMREVLEHRMDIVERAKKALAANGVEPRCVPIRGGTDGATLSFMGLPCPNVGTGAANGLSLIHI